ncbi:hypothetical protein ACFL6N_05240 [Thermodesulfobacteriota bacterium]
MNIFRKDPYQPIVNFIDAAIESKELIAWLIFLEEAPENLRWQHLANIKSQMIQNNEDGEIIYIVELLDNKEILFAMNAVINDVNESGMRAKKLLKSGDNSNFNLLISLIAAP